MLRPTPLLSTCVEPSRRGTSVSRSAVPFPTPPASVPAIETLPACCQKKAFSGLASVLESTLFTSLLAILLVIAVLYKIGKRMLSFLPRVVLIDFPSPEMKPVGLVTRVMKDTTTPNPTSGYLEIIPLDRVTSTDWSLDEAMAFIMSGGAVAPDSMNYDQLTAKKE